MRKIKSIVKDVMEIYQKSGNEAKEYLRRARRLKEKFGPGLAVVYCWFYSVPQKWTQVEPKIFELMKYTNSFDLNTTLSIPIEEIAMNLKPMIFYNEISLQLHNFCKVVKNEYSSWDNFTRALVKEKIFDMFKRLRRCRNIRFTFKNLSAMKIFIGMDDGLLILDTHTAKVFGLKKEELGKYRTQETYFQHLVETSNKITERLRKELNEVTTAKWSLAIWFDKTKVHGNELLIKIPPY